MRKNLFIIIGVSTFCTLILFTLILQPFKAQSQSSGEFDILKEFNSDVDQATKKYNHVINCFFNRALQYTTNTYNQQFIKNTKQSKITVQDITSTQIKCEDLPPIGRVYFEKLELLLENIEKNQTSASKTESNETFLQKMQDQSTETTQNNICNLNFETNKYQVISSDFFSQEQARVLSPVYAVALVSHCYFSVYDIYLSYQENTAIETLKKNQPDVPITFLEIGGKLASLEEEYEKNRDKAEKVLNLALARLDEYSKSYPQHIRYEELIWYSQRLRDQMRRLRVATDQLQYKLPNNSTKICE